MVERIGRLCAHRVPDAGRASRGFTLIELLIVILIVGILAAVATPLYLGYIKDAKTAEAKAIAGSLWTAIQGNAIASCGTAVKVSDAFPKAGLDASGSTTPGRWIATGSKAMSVSCRDGSYVVESPLFVIEGKSKDVDFIKVRLVYDATASPPSRLQCDTGSGSFADC